MEEQALDFALKTFACGLFPDRSGRDSIEQKDGDSGWQCVANPTEIPGAPGFTSLAAGEDGCLGITPEGDVHRWVATGNSGTITRGFAMEWTLSVLKDEANQRLQLRDIALGYRSQSPSRLSCCSGKSPRSRGRLVAVALMDSGDVFASQAWYDDGGDGREGHLPMSCPEWQPLPSLQSTLVAAVACGGGFAMALTAGGELFAWGSSPEGAMGTGSLGDVTRPTLVRGPLAKCRVAVIACGECHSVAATFDEEDRLGAVYSWGLVAADGRLGYVDDEVHPQSSPREVSWISAQLVAVLTLRRGALAVPRGSSRRLPQRITQVSCGWRHSVLVCQGSVVCFGANDFGQLGRCAKEPQEVRSKIPPFAHCPLLEDSDHRTIEEARRLCCGPLHTACVCSTGHVHVWGLDLQQGMKARAPWCVPDFGPVRPVVALCCGAHFLVCSAEVVLPRSTEAQIDVPQEDLLLGYCAESLAPGTRSGPATSSNSWRPSHLPPKCEEESKHHQNLVRELERSVQRRLLQEQREVQQRQQREQRRERRLQEHTELWFQLLPNFVPGEGVTARMQRLWRQGLPPKVREVLWPVAIGNVLRITPELFEIHKQRALDARKNQENAASNVLITLTDAPRSRGKEQSTTCIPFDLPRTFPTLAFFDEGGPLHEDCARILEAYTFFRPDIGYVQGMSYLAAMLLLYLPSYQAFVGLCNLLNTPSVLGLYRLEPQAMACRARVFEQLCFQQLPAVARCIENVGLTPEMFLIDWFLTIFAKCLSVDVASVVWDLFLLDGEVVLYCTAIAILRILEDPLLHPDGRRGPKAVPPDLESCFRVLNEELRSRVHDPDELLWHIDQVRRRTPHRICVEIRAIENTEFGTGRSFTVPSPTASFFAAAKDRMSRLFR